MKLRETLLSVYLKGSSAAKQKSSCFFFFFFKAEDWILNDRGKLLVKRRLSGNIILWRVKGVLVWCGYGTDGGCSSQVDV